MLVTLLLSTAPRAEAFDAFETFDAPPDDKFAAEPLTEVFPDMLMVIFIEVLAEVLADALAAALAEVLTEPLAEMLAEVLVEMLVDTLEEAEPERREVFPDVLALEALIVPLSVPLPEPFPVAFALLSDDMETNAVLSAQTAENLDMFTVRLSGVSTTAM